MKISHCGNIKKIVIKIYYKKIIIIIIIVIIYINLFYILLKNSWFNKIKINKI